MSSPRTGRRPSAADRDLAVRTPVLTLGGRSGRTLSDPELNLPPIALPPPAPVGPSDATPNPTRGDLGASSLSITVPFLVPPQGRLAPPPPESVEVVRRALDTRKAHETLDRIGGRMPRSKRALDLLFAAALGCVLSPLLIVVAACIKVTDGGPVLFWQRRVGFRGREFAFPKFRSMMSNADRLVKLLETRNDHVTKAPDGRPKQVTFKMKKDPRITWIGRIIRKLSIDEVPQLWCILKGDMSVVGPRPPLPKEVAQYSKHDRRRLDVVPGLTCIWQVSGRGDVPFPQQVEMDLEYIEKQSLWLDLKLIFLTVPAVLRGKGAY